MLETKLFGPEYLKNMYKDDANLLKYMLHVKSVLKMVTIGIMDSCLNQINCVCLSVPLESCLGLNHMKVV